jgi:hypothetical protein
VEPGRLRMSSRPPFAMVAMVAMVVMSAGLAFGCARDERAGIEKAPEGRRDAPSVQPTNAGPVVWLVLDRRRMEALGVEIRAVEAALGREPRIPFSLERYDADMYELRLGPRAPDPSLLDRKLDGKTDLQRRLSDIAKLEVRSK